MPRIYGAQAISLKNVSMTEAVSRLWPHTDAYWAQLCALMNIDMDAESGISFDLCSGLGCFLPGVEAGT